MSATRFELRLDDDQLDAWREAAKLAGVDLSAYVRGAVSGRIKVEAALRAQQEAVKGERDLLRREAFPQRP